MHHREPLVPVLINVDSNQTDYAIPVAQDELAAVAASNADSLVPSVVGADYKSPCLADLDNPERMCSTWGLQF